MISQIIKIPKIFWFQGHLTSQNIHHRYQVNHQMCILFQYGHIIIYCLITLLLKFHLQNFKTSQFFFKNHLVKVHLFLIPVILKQIFHHRCLKHLRGWLVFKLWYIYLSCFLYLLLINHLYKNIPLHYKPNFLLE